MEELKKPLYEMTTAAYKQEPAADGGAAASEPSTQEQAAGEQPAGKEGADGQA